MEPLKIRPFHHEGQVELSNGDVLHLVMNFRTIDVIESMVGEGMDEIIPQLVKPSQSLATKILWAMLREKHEGVTLDQAHAIAVAKVDGLATGVVMWEIIRAANNLEEAKGENPPKRRGRSKASSKSGSPPVLTQ